MAWSIFTAGRTSAGISSVPVTPARASSSTGHRRGWSGSRNLYAAHGQLTGAWARADDGRLHQARQAWDDAIGAADEARARQMAAPGLQEPAKKALATLDPCPGTPARLARKPGASRHGPAGTGRAGITPAPAL